MQSSMHCPFHERNEEIFHREIRLIQAGYNFDIEEFLIELEFDITSCDETCDAKRNAKFLMSERNGYQFCKWFRAQSKREKKYGERDIMSGPTGERREEKRREEKKEGTDFQVSLERLQTLCDHTTKVFQSNIRRCEMQIDSLTKRFERMENDKNSYKRERAGVEQAWGNRGSSDNRDNGDLLYFWT